MEEDSLTPQIPSEDSSAISDSEIIYLLQGAMEECTLGCSGQKEALFEQKGDYFATSFVSDLLARLGRAERLLAKVSAAAASVKEYSLKTALRWILVQTEQLCATLADSFTTTATMLNQHYIRLLQLIYEQHYENAVCQLKNRLKFVLFLIDVLETTIFEQQVFIMRSRHDQHTLTPQVSLEMGVDYHTNSARYHGRMLAWQRSVMRKISQAERELDELSLYLLQLQKY